MTTLGEEALATLALVESSARELAEQELAEAAARLRREVAAPRLKVLVVGEAGSGRATVTNLLLGRPNLLPVSAVPRPPTGVTLDFGTPDRVLAVGQGAEVPLLPNPIEATLRAAIASGDYASVGVWTTARLLERASVRVEDLAADRPEDAWAALLGETHFVVLVLRAVALLSARERRFIAEVLEPRFGLERVAMLINQADLVDDDERSQLERRVRHFLGPYEAQPVVVIRDRDGHGDEALQSLLERDLLAGFGELRRAALERAAALALGNLRARVEARSALIDADEAGLAELVSTLDAQGAWIRERVDRAHRRLDADVGALIGSSLVRDVEDFGATLREQLAVQVRAAPDLEAARRHLPGYVESLWSAFLVERTARARAELAGTVESLGRMVEEDLKAVTAEHLPGSAAAQDALQPQDVFARLFLPPARGDSLGTTAANLVQLFGLFASVASLGTAVAALGLGHVLRQLVQPAQVKADKEAIVASLREGLAALEREVKAQVEVALGETLAALKRGVAEAYEQGAAALRVRTEDALRRRGDVAAQRETLERVAERLAAAGAEVAA